MIRQDVTCGSCNESSIILTETEIPALFCPLCGESLDSDDDETGDDEDGESS